MKNISSEQFKRAAELQAEIEVRQAEIDQIFGENSENGVAVVRNPVPAPATPRPTAKVVGRIGARRTMSLEARNKIAAAQRARWARVHAGVK